MRIFSTAIILAITCSLGAQVKKPVTEQGTKLIVGIVVDQMRNDYISRYWNRFGPGGFKRLVNEGYYFRNSHYNYIPTYTAPGHASIYTGATPAGHGIIANDWYSRKNNNYTYCVSDSSVRAAGSKSKSGMMSPRNLLSTTIGDELKMATNQRSKVFAFAIKDRSAILPAGHAADGAFWYDDATGDFISSTFYMNDLPRWLKNFNDERYAKTFLEKGWKPLYPVETYTLSVSDDNAYEASPNKKEKPVFPYEYTAIIEKSGFGILKATPFGNTITKDVAMECLRKEQLGRHDDPDMLFISFSATDIISHAFGTRAVEVEDTYLRLDKDIEDMLNTLDKEVGKNNYTIFLTADHGGADVPRHLSDHRIPAGYIYEKNIERSLKVFLQQQYGDSLLAASVGNEQFFLNEKKMLDARINRNELEDRVAAFLLGINGIAVTYPAHVISNGSFDAGTMQSLLKNGYNQKLSGNVFYVYQPGWMDYSQTGTTHGSGYRYDTHIPVLFFGKGIKKGSSFRYTTITQIAPTVSELLGIPQPNATMADPLNDDFK